MLRNADQTEAEQQLNSRFQIFRLVVLILFAVVIGRLFYWQIIQASDLQAEAEAQYQRSSTKFGSRGLILTADNHLLVANQQVYRVFAQPQTLDQDPVVIAKVLNPILLKDFDQYHSASSAVEKEQLAITSELSLVEKLSKKDSRWISLATTISDSVKSEILNLHLKGIGFDPYEIRSYPEASMAAQLTGFVGKNEAGEDTGYFGIEGGLDQELKGRQLKTTILTDAFGQQLTAEKGSQRENLNGRDVTLTIRRDLQYLAEKKLGEGIKKYGAQAGEIIILEPKTGKILALATRPNYNQANFYTFDASLYQNPSLNSLYEPGSTFKLLTVAAGLEEKVISPTTECSTCSGPRVFGQYVIRTWNDQYNPNISMTDALAKSDNTAMIFVAEKLGADRLKKYLHDFGVGEALHIDLQGDVDTPFPQHWGPVELATISFGQGVSISSLQLVRAVATIANKGVMMRPQIGDGVSDPATGEFTPSEPITERTVISPATADQLTDMMIEAALHGEAQWTASKTHQIAGKTGTSQVAEAGGYNQDKTIVSFVGFAPPQDPKFVMLVKLIAPTSSIWAAETAAPLWYSAADELYLALNIPPDRWSANSKRKSDTSAL